MKLMRGGFNKMVGGVEKLIDNIHRYDLLMFPLAYLFLLHFGGAICNVS